MEEKKGWSWLGFLFMPYYYAGYGALQKGSIFAILTGFIAGIEVGTSVVALIIVLFIGIGTAIYGGMNAKKELPVGKQDFSWKNVIIATVAYTIAMFISSILFLALSGGTPKCNDTETKNLVIEIAGQKAYNVIYDNLNIKNIRTSSFDDNIDKYECAAELEGTIKNTNQSMSHPITYTSQSTDDSDSFYVEVYGL
jgi:hypothetical protein